MGNIVDEGTGEELIKLLQQQPNERCRLIQLSHGGDLQRDEDAVAEAEDWILAVK